MSNAGWTFHKAVKYWASSLDPTWQKVLKGIDSLQSNNMIGFCLSFGSGDWLSTLRLLCWLPAAVSEPWRALRPTQRVMMAEKKGEWGPLRVMMAEVKGEKSRQACSSYNSSWLSGLILILIFSICLIRKMARRWHCLEKSLLTRTEKSVPLDNCRVNDFEALKMF